MDRTPIWVSTTPHEKDSPLVGEEIGEVREGEDSSKSLSFAKISKKNPHPSPPLTRGRKSNKKCREKEAKSRTNPKNYKHKIKIHIVIALYPLASTTTSPKINLQIGKDFDAGIAS